MESWSKLEADLVDERVLESRIKGATGSLSANAVFRKWALADKLPVAPKKYMWHF